MGGLGEVVVRMRTVNGGVVGSMGCGGWVWVGMGWGGGLDEKLGVMRMGDGVGLGGRKWGWWEEEERSDGLVNIVDTATT